MHANTVLTHCKHFLSVEQQLMQHAGIESVHSCQSLHITQHQSSVCSEVHDIITGTLHHLSSQEPPPVLLECLIGLGAAVQQASHPAVLFAHHMAPPGGLDDSSCSATLCQHPAPLTLRDTEEVGEWGGWWHVVRGVHVGRAAKTHKTPPARCMSHVA
jgi:hypothetical protein